MNHDQSAQSQASVPLEQIAGYVHELGLATPALMLLGIGRPLGIVAGQCLVLLQPLMPGHRWQAQVGQMATVLGDDAAWTRLENLLQ